jgi:hypothetical protein
LQQQNGRTIHFLVSSCDLPVHNPVLTFSTPEDNGGTDKNQFFIPACGASIFPDASAIFPVQ